MAAVWRGGMSMSPRRPPVHADPEDECEGVWHVACTLPAMIPRVRWAVACLLLLAACGGPAGDAADPTLEVALDTLPPVETTTPAPSTPLATPTSTTTTTQPPKTPIVLGFAGDTSFTHGLDGRDPLGNATEMLSAPDLTAVNLETTVGEPGVGAPLGKTYIFRSPPRTVELLREAGVDVVSLANNHTLDHRREGLLRTMELLEEGDIGYFGAGADSASAYGTLTRRVGDWDVGFVGFTHIECGWVADDPTRWPESAWACPGFEARTVDAVTAADDAADFVVVMVHWGIERDHCPQSYQRDLARQWVDAGADLIVGSHPHVLQGLEHIDGAWVIHSTGNFAFPSARSASARSAFFTATISEQSVDITVRPVEIVDGRPRPMGADSAESLLSDLSEWSFGWEFDAAGIPSRRTESGTCD